MRLVWGYAPIRRGNAVRHIAQPTESKALCGRRLGPMYELRASINEIGNLCRRCRWKYNENPDLRLARNE